MKNRELAMILGGAMAMIGPKAMSAVIGAHSTKSLAISPKYEVSQETQNEKIRKAEEKRLRKQLKKNK